MDIAVPALVRDIGGQRWPINGPAYMPKPSATLELTIAAASAFTNVFEFTGYKYFGIQMPSAMDGTTFRVHGLITEPTAIGDMLTVDNGAGSMIEWRYAVDTVSAPSPSVFYGLSAVRYIALETRTALAGATQVQSVERTLTVMLMG